MPCITFDEGNPDFTQGLRGSFNSPCGSGGGGASSEPTRLNIKTTKNADEGIDKPQSTEQHVAPYIHRLPMKPSVGPLTEQRRNPEEGRDKDQNIEKHGSTNKQKALTKPSVGLLTKQELRYILKPQKSSTISPEPSSLGQQNPIEYDLQQQKDVLYLDWLKHQTEYFNGPALKLRQEMFEWQLHSSQILFWIVIAMVLFGMFLSGIQFYQALRFRPGPDSTESDTASKASKVPVPTDQTTIEASVTGIKISSSVIGLLLLIVSLLFFYLYLKTVYPITGWTTADN